MGKTERRLALALVLLAGAAGPAAAHCTWEWLCNGEGACKQMPICDSVDEVPPPRPDVKPPVPPPLAMRPTKVAGGRMSTLTCEHIMRQTKAGRWEWVETCYCTDKSKTTDPTRPFANIVRCDAR